MLELNRVYNMDCIDGMRLLPDNFADMILTDPPYCSDGTHSTDRKLNTRAKYTNEMFNGAAGLPNFTGDNMDQRSFTEFMRMVFHLARIKSKPSAILAAFIDWRNLPALTDAVQMAGWVWRGIVVWDKKGTRPQMGRFLNQSEYVVWGSNGDLSVKDKHFCLPGVYSYANVSSKKRRHQTEKPIALLCDLLKIIPSNSIVIDPFIGSGSTCEACKEMKQNYIGFELETCYYETAKERLHQK